MAKFECGSLDHTGFLAIKENLTAALAEGIKEQLDLMGEDAKGITWFSSAAETYACERMKRAA